MTLRVPVDLHTLLKIVSQAESKSMNTLVGEAIDRYLQKPDNKRKIEVFNESRQVIERYKRGRK